MVATGSLGHLHVKKSRCALGVYETVRTRLPGGSYITTPQSKDDLRIVQIPARSQSNFGR